MTVCLSGCVFEGTNVPAIYFRRLVGDPESSFFIKTLVFLRAACIMRGLRLYLGGLALWCCQLGVSGHIVFDSPCRLALLCNRVPRTCLRMLERPC